MVSLINPRNLFRKVLWRERQKITLKMIKDHFKSRQKISTRACLDAWLCARLASPCAASNLAAWAYALLHGHALFYPASLGSLGFAGPLFFDVIHSQSRSFHRNQMISPKSKTSHFISAIWTKGRRSRFDT